MCDDEASFAADKYVTYIHGFATSAAFSLNFRGGNIITCAQKPLNSVAANTVPVNVVPRTFSQAPMVLAHRIRQWSVPLRFVTVSLSLEPLVSYQFFFLSILYSLSSRSWSPLENTPSLVTSWINYVIEHFKLLYFSFMDVTRFRSPTPAFLTSIVLRVPTIGERFFSFQIKGRSKGFPEASSPLLQTRLPYCF